MPQIKVTYQAFGKIETVIFPFHTPIGNIHDHLFDICNAYRIIELETVKHQNNG